MPVDTQHAHELQQMWDQWWYDRFELPNDIPADARKFEVVVDDEVIASGALLDHIAPKTCEAFASLLPYRGDIIHNAFFGHCSYYLDRFPQIVDQVGYELENRSVRLAPGDWIWDPWLEEITWAYGRYAEMRFPTTIHTESGGIHPNQGCIFARITENLNGWARLCKSLRYEGYKVMETRLKD